MSDSAFKQVQAALVAALQADAGLAGVIVRGNQTRALPREEQAGVMVRLDVSRKFSGSLGVTDWETAFEVETIVRATSGSDPADALDPLLQSVWSALHAVSLPSVTDVDFDPSLDWTFDAGDTPLGSVLFRISVRHRTDLNTLNPKD